VQPRLDGDEVIGGAGVEPPQRRDCAHAPRAVGGAELLLQKFTKSQWPSIFTIARHSGVYF
jgi:hypothetical protein